MLGLSLLIPNLPAECDAFLNSAALSPLQSFLHVEKERERQLEVLGVLCLFLGKNSDLFPPDQLEFLQTLSRSLFSSSSRYEERKKALACLSSLAFCIADDAFHSLVSSLLSEANSESSPSNFSFILQVWWKYLQLPSSSFHLISLALISLFAHSANNILSCSCPVLNRPSWFS